MTRTRLAALAVVSVFATALVLASAGSSGPSPTALAAVAQRVQAARAVAAAPPPTTPAKPRVSPPVSSPTTAAAPAVADTTPAASTADAPATTTPKPTKPASKPKSKPSKVGHVFVIALTGAGYQQTFGAQSSLPYVATELAPQGAVLSNFGPVDTAADLPNYLALAGGLKPNAATRANCATYSDDACVQPNTVLSLGDQVSSSGRIWRAYLEGMGEMPCVHPDNGTADATLTQTTGYVTRHNPFVYFHSLVDLSDCQANDLDLSKLPDDLKTVKTTPNLAFVAPALGDDPDAFLRTWVPQIRDSPAYEKDGVLVIAFLSGPSPTGALVLSPYARKASLYAKPYDPYALLRSVEALFALDPLGQAKKAPSFAKTVLTSAFEGRFQP